MSNLVMMAILFLIPLGALVIIYLITRYAVYNLLVALKKEDLLNGKAL
ncbi:MAG: hypothetical protein WDA53_00960 [Bacillota bacterium]